MIRALMTFIRRDHMDLTLHSPPGLTVRIVERPGLWMSRDELTALNAHLFAVAEQTLDGRALEYGVFSGQAEALSDKILTLVSDADGRPIAFNALTVMQVDIPPRPETVLHLGLVMVAPQARSAGLSWVLYGLTCFLLIARNRLHPIWVSNVTQVPAVLGMVSGMVSDIWPAPNRPQPGVTQQLLARAIMTHHRQVFGVGPDAAFDPARGVITNAYTGGSDHLQKSWADVPKHRDPLYNDFCADQLDYVRGDDLLQLGRMDLAAVQRYLGRSVPKNALPGVIRTAARATTQRLILPVLQWSDPTRPFSILRPWGSGT